MSLDVYQRLLALQQRRAVPVATRRHRHLSIRPFVIVGYHLAGEPSAPVALCYGTDRDRPTVRAVVEPRDRQQRFTALGDLARALSRYLSRYGQTEVTVTAGLDVATCCVDAPQLLVPNEATGHWLGLLGQYLRVVDSDPALQTAGAHLGWFGGRRRLPGSSALLAATELLTTHWRTGQLPTEDGHLGRLLAWVEGRPDEIRRAPITATRNEHSSSSRGERTQPEIAATRREEHQSALRAETLRPEVAAGPVSDPGWDREQLRPAIDRAKETGDPSRLHALLAEALEPTWRDVWTAYDLVRLLPPGAHVAPRWESDRWSWTRHRERVTDGTAAFHTRLADVPAFRFLHELETRTVALERQMALDDPLVMAHYVASGEAVAGTVVKRDVEHTERGSSGRPVLRPLLWLRTDTEFDRPVGTELWLGRVGVTVRGVAADTIELMVTSGAVTRPKLKLLPECDADVVLAPFGPEQRFPDNLPDDLPWPARPAISSNKSPGLA